MIEEFAQNQKYLIIGMGRAGKRHTKTLLSDFGVRRKNVIGYDPDSTILDNHLITVRADEDILKDDYDIIVIASPPDTHAEYIGRYKEKRILCEKPLTGRNNLHASPDAENLMVAYNYLHNPDVILAIAEYKKQKKYIGEIQILSSHHRKKLPEWGIVYDHLPHSIALLTFIEQDDGRINVNNATFSKDNTREMISVDLSISFESRARITEIVNFTERIERISTVLMPNGYSFELTPEPIMFKNMWSDFFLSMMHGTKPFPDITFGRTVQMNLDRVNDYLREKYHENYWQTDNNIDTIRQSERFGKKRFLDEHNSSSSYTHKTGLAE